MSERYDSMKKMIPPKPSVEFMCLLWVMGESSRSYHVWKTRHLHGIHVTMNISYSEGVGRVMLLFVVVSMCSFTFVHIHQVLLENIHDIYLNYKENMNERR